jgi:hypothetical protein
MYWSSLRQIACVGYLFHIASHDNLKIENLDFVILFASIHFMIYQSTRSNCSSYSGFISFNNADPFWLGFNFSKVIIYFTLMNIRSVKWGLLFSFLLEDERYVPRLRYLLHSFSPFCSLSSCMFSKQDSHFC